MGHIFISYSHKDKEYVHQLQDALQKEGFDVWIDDRIDYGTEWPKVIQQHLDQCDAFIVVLTENAFESKWVQNEVARADRKKKPFFPLLLQGDPWLSVEARQYVDVRNRSLPPERFFASLSNVSSRKNKESSPTFSKTIKEDDAVSDGGSLWAVIMSKSSAGQVQFSDTSFPTNKIDQYWKEGKGISEVSFGASKWIVVMSTDTECPGQFYVVNKQFPGEDIKQAWDKGKRITSVAYGQQSWCVVMSKTTRLSEQVYLLTSSFPSSFIEENWNEGKRITSIGYSNSQWLIVMSKDTNVGLQSYKTGVAYPRNYIKEYWDKGYRIGCITYGAGIWMVVMSNGTSQQQQSWQTSGDFPDQYIRDKYKDGYVISVVANSWNK